MLFNKKKGSIEVVKSTPEGSGPLVAIDLGSFTIRIVAGEVMNDGRIRVLAREERPSAGIVNGAVSNLSALEDTLSSLINDFINKHKLPIRHCYIGVAGRFIDARNEKGSATVLSQRVTETDRRNAIENASAVPTLENYHTIHIIPQVYEVENSSEVIDPVGLSAMRVGVRAHIISCDRNHERNLRSALTSVSSEIVVDDVIYNGLAASDAVLTESEKEIGVCLINIGDGTVDVTVYERGRILFSFGLKHGGGRAITRTIAEFIGIPLQDAELFKVRQGSASVEGLNGQERQVSYYADDRKEQTFTLVQLAEIINQNLTGTFTAVYDHIGRHAAAQSGGGPNLSLGAGFVLTGGVANTRGIVDVARRALSPSPNMNVKVRIGTPRAFTGDDAMNNPSYAVVLGLLRAGHNISSRHRADTGVRNEGEKTFMTKVRDWFSREL